MWVVKVILVISVLSFTHSVQAAVPIKLVRRLHTLYITEKRVLLYIGRHAESKNIAIWGKTILTEEMVEIHLEAGATKTRMEKLLRSNSNRWKDKNYKNYILDSFIVSKPKEKDAIFLEIVRNSPHMKLLDGYVNRIEEVDNTTRFFNIEDKEVEVVEKLRGGGVVECVYGEGDACQLLREGYEHYADVLPILTEVEKVILDYFEQNMEALQRDGIIISDMADTFRIDSGSLGQKIRYLKNKLDKDHFIHKIKGEQQTVNGESKTSYRFADALTEVEKVILNYFEQNMEALQRDGIIISDMADTFRIDSGSLGQKIRYLKDKLDENHFIHKIEGKKRRVDRKYRYYLPISYADNAAATSKQLYIEGVDLR